MREDKHKAFISSKNQTALSKRSMMCYVPYDDDGDGDDVLMLPDNKGNP